MVKGGWSGVVVEADRVEVEVDGSGNGQALDHVNGYVPDYIKAADHVKDVPASSPDHGRGRVSGH